jgi:hypothetical protein
MIEVKILFPDQAALIAFFSGKPAANLAEPTTSEMVAALQTKNASAGVTSEKQAAARASIAAGKAETKATTEKASDKIVEKQADKVDYLTLQKAVFDLVGKVKVKGLDPAEHVLGIAKGFGFANFALMKEAGPEGAKHFADALAAVVAKAAEVDALEAAVA